MNKHFKNQPAEAPTLAEPLPTVEYLSWVIANNSYLWDEVDDLFQIKTSNTKEETRKKFKDELLSTLSFFLYDTPPVKAVGRKKESRLDQLYSLEKSLSHSIENSDLIAYELKSFHSDKHAPISTKKALDQSIKSYNSSIANLELMLTITRTKINVLHNLEKKEDPKKLNAHLKYDLATKLCYLAKNFDLEIAQTPEGFFDRLYKLCWQAITFSEKEIGDRDKQLQKAIKDFRKNEKTIL